MNKEERIKFKEKTKNEEGNKMKKDKFRYIKDDLSNYEKEELNNDYNLDVYKEDTFAIAVITKEEYHDLLSITRIKENIIGRIKEEEREKLWERAFR